LSATISKINNYTIVDTIFDLVSCRRANVCSP